MDRRRMDAEGGRVVHRSKRSSRLVLVVALQNLLVVACLVITLYVYWNTERQPFEDNVHLQFEPIADLPSNRTVQFLNIDSNNKMGLVDKTNDKIYIDCTGPYVLYVDVCYRILRGDKATGKLQLKVAGIKTPVTSIYLNTSNEVCEGLHSIAYLKANQVASLHFSSDKLKVKNVTVGLSYLLGSRCEY